MVADSEGKVPQVTLPRVEQMFPDIWKKGTVHVAQTNVKRAGETGSLLTSIFQKMPALQGKETPPITKTEGQNGELRDDLVLEAIAVNKNRSFYNPHVCPACNLILKNKARLMMHLEMHIIKKKLGKKTKVLAESKKKKALGVHNMNARGRQYSCSFCDEIYMSEQDLVAHKIKHFEEKYGCPECDLTFRTTIYLNIHIESVHAFNNRRKCPSEKLPKKPAAQLQPIKRKWDSKKLLDKVKRVKQK